jgi:hypothetical protein
MAASWYERFWQSNLDMPRAAERPKAFSKTETPRIGQASHRSWSPNRLGNCSHEPQTRCSKLSRRLHQAVDQFLQTVVQGARNTGLSGDLSTGITSS